MPALSSLESNFLEDHPTDMDFCRTAAGAVFPDRPLKKSGRELFAARVKCGAHFDRGLASKLPDHRRDPGVFIYHLQTGILRAGQSLVFPNEFKLNPFTEAP